MKLKLQIPEAMQEFLEPAFLKVPYGGRSSSKTQSVMRIMLIKMMQGRSVGCFREIQKSIKDSIKKSFDMLIDDLGWRQYFEGSTDTEIRCFSGAKMIFAGLKHNVTNVKGMDWLDDFFVEEAENVSADSWEVLIPTARKPGAEVWVVFNPKLITDATYQKFIINPPPKFVTRSSGEQIRYSIIKKINYPDNPWFTEESRQQMLVMKEDDPELYKHIWLGEPISDSALSIIKPMWIEAALDAHLKLGIERTGNRFAGLDPMDEGEDYNARCYRDGVIVYQIDEWKDKDPVAVGERCYAEAMQDGIGCVSYDNIGVGAGTKGKFREMETALIAAGRHLELVPFTEFTASASPIDGEYMPGRANADHFLNLKAQGWFMLRDRFHNTYKAVVEGKDVDMENIICIDTSGLDKRIIDKMKAELSAPNREYSNGKLKVESKDSLKKRGIPSPNIADAIVMAFNPEFDSGYSLDAW
ncbi:MAG: PBSX family phage terminase large subunit [Plesiomonas shigelloides]